MIRSLFVQSRLLEQFIANFIPYETHELVSEEELKRIKSPEYVSKVIVRGIIMNCCNAIRLQAAAMPPTDFLRQYLDDCEIWNHFVPVLRSATEFQQNHAMGLSVSENRTGLPAHLAVVSLSAEPKPDSEIDHGSRLAKSLGFVDEVAWPIDPSNSSAGFKRDNEDDIDGGLKKNKTGSCEDIDGRGDDHLEGARVSEDEDEDEEVPDQFSDLTI